MILIINKIQERTGCLFSQNFDKLNKQPNSLQNLLVDFLDSNFNIMPVEEFETILIVSIFIGLSQSAGVGGGLVINICLLLLYDQKTSIAVTYIFLMGASLASIFKGIIQRQKNNRIAVVNLDLIIITLPLLCTGSMVGSLIKYYPSKLVITILFIILFAYLIAGLIIILRKSIKKRNLKKRNLLSQIIKSKIIDQTITAPQSVILSNFSGLSNQKIRFRKLFILVFLAIFFYCITILVTLLKGSSKLQSIIGLERCSYEGWLVPLAHFILSLSAGLIIVKKMSNDELKIQKLKLHHQLSTTESIASSNLKQSNLRRNINHKYIKNFFVAGFFAGLFGSVLGIGGVPILLPIWLKSSIPPVVGTITTPPLILISSIIAFTISALNGSYNEIPIVTLLAYFLISFVTSFLMKILIEWLTRKSGKKELPLYILLAIIIVSFATYLPYSAWEFNNYYDDYVRVGQIC